MAVVNSFWLWAARTVGAGWLPLVFLRGICRERELGAYAAIVRGAVWFFPRRKRYPDEGVVGSNKGEHLQVAGWVAWCRAGGQGKRGKGGLISRIYPDGVLGHQEPAVGPAVEECARMSANCHQFYAGTVTPLSHHHGRLEVGGYVGLRI